VEALMSRYLLGSTLAVIVVVSMLFGIAPAGGLTRHSTFCETRLSQSAGEGLRLAISKKRVSPSGATPLMMRLKNGGSEAFSYSLLYRLDHFEGGAWTRVPTRPVFSPLLMLYGESTGECEEVSPTQKFSSGWYRVSKSVKPVGAGPAKRREVRATFKVGGS
jgi:hypothetical protein